MTGQTLLNYMEIVFPELQLQAGENGVTKGLLALNIAQDAFETLVAQEPELLGGSVSSVSTTVGQEYTVYPTGLLRIDRMQYLNPATSLPVWNVERIQSPGDHAYPVMWPGNLVSTNTQGTPRKYWTNGTRIYWLPIPNAVSTVRIYGFSQASDITASGTFAYLDQVAFPLAAIAVRVIRVGLDDSAGDIQGLAQNLLTPTIEMMKRFNRDGPLAFRYKYLHRT